MTEMTDYSPDDWVVLKVKEGKGTFPFYKVLAGWRGGPWSATWRINSGITLVFDHEDEVHFYGESGSVYRCPKEGYGLSGIQEDIYNELRKKQEFNGQIFLMPEDTDWSEVKY